MVNKALELIEEAFSEYLLGKLSNAQLEKKLEVGLDALPFNSKKSFSVHIMFQKQSKQNFFGVNVFPSVDYISSICDTVANDNITFLKLCKKWKTIPEWEISLDSMLFDRNLINFNPKELTAMLLHEVGHVIESDRPIEYFYRAYKEANTRMKAASQISKKFLYILYTIPLATACMQKFWVTEKNELRAEIAADLTLLDTGYAEHLISAFDKIIKVFGSINEQESLKYKTVETSVDWCNINIVDISKRRDTLKDELYYTAIKSNSGYIQALCSRILDFLGVRLRERYTGAVVESAGLMDLCNGTISLDQYVPVFDLKVYGALEAMIVSSQSTIAVESFLNKRKNKRVEMPSQYDVDRIAVEIDKISNHYDRVYVLDLIYDCLERISLFEEAIATNDSETKKYSSKIADMRAQLDVLRKATLDKKNLEKSYRFFVKYPEGYEG